MELHRQFYTYILTRLENVHNCSMNKRYNCQIFLICSYLSEKLIRLGWIYSEYMRGIKLIKAMIKILRYVNIQLKLLHTMSL